MKYIDLHQDLLCHMKTREQFNQSHQTNLNLLSQSNAACVVATAFPIPPNENFFHPNLPNLIEQEFIEYSELCQKNPDWNIIKTASDLKDALSGNKRGLILHIEGLNVLPENLTSTLDRWYDLGWRSLGIVWTRTNPLGGGTNEEGGLTQAGADLIEYATQKGIIIDYAHMNRQTFEEVSQIHNGPIYISHAAVDTLCPSPRNVTDEQLKLLPERDGVVGVFLVKKHIGSQANVSIDDVINHIRYLKERIGINHIAIGSDFGGIISGTIDGLACCDELPNLWKALTNAGFSTQEIEAIAWKNAYRVLSKILKT